MKKGLRRADSAVSSTVSSMSKSFVCTGEFSKNACARDAYQVVLGLNWPSCTCELHTEPILSPSARTHSVRPHTARTLRVEWGEGLAS